MSFLSACRPPALAVLLCGGLCTIGRAEDVPAAPATFGDGVEGAIGLLASYGPDYGGAATSHGSASPGIFLRYRRLTVTNAGGFATKNREDVARGIGLDLVQNDHLRVNFALRIDNGRSESTSGALAGMGDIDRTIRVRASATRQLGDGWRVGASWNADLLGQGGGHYADVSFAREVRLDPRAFWTWGGSLTGADNRYMRTYYGVNAEQSARSGHPQYIPDAGLRDAGLYANLNADLGERWVLLAGVGVSRQLGPAASSPLTVKPVGWGVNSGLAWRF